MNLHEVIRTVLHINEYSPYWLSIQRTGGGDVSVEVYVRPTRLVGACLFSKGDWHRMLLGQPIEGIFQGD